MRMPFALMLIAVFTLLAAWHFVMASRPAAARVGGAVPSVDGRPLFVPSTRATVGVAIGLLACGALIAVAMGWIDIGLSTTAPRVCCDLLALGLVARAIGDFRYVGFFKRVRGSRFARLDSIVYSPSCLLLALTTGFVANTQ